MKIFYIVPYVPNQIYVRPFQLIRTLQRRGHEVTLATLWTTEQERADLGALAAEGISILSQRLPKVRSLWNCVQALPRRLPLQAAYCWQPHLTRMVAERLKTEPFHVVHVEHLRGARYGIELQKGPGFRDVGTPVVWDSVDCISHLFEQALQNSPNATKRLLMGVDLPRTRRYEGWLVHQFDRVITTSEHDARALQTLAQHHAQQRGKNQAACGAFPPITVIPNGVDMDYFAPNGATRDAATIVFTGKMSYHANIAAARHLVHNIMPHIWEERPDIHLQIVGKDPTPEVRALDTSPGGGGPNQSRCVTVTGTVPDLRAYLQRATLAVAPVPYGAGIQNKVLEAMACGAPVIASTQSASGLDAQSERDLIVASDTASFVRASLWLLNSPRQREALGQAGLQYVQRRHSWHSAAARLEAVYQDAIHAHAPTPI